MITIYKIRLVVRNSSFGQTSTPRVALLYRSRRVGEALINDRLIVATSDDDGKVNGSCGAALWKFRPSGVENRPGAAGEKKTTSRERTAQCTDNRKKI